MASSLQSLADRAKERSAAIKRETDAKVEALEAQAKKASHDTKTKLRERIAELKASHDARMEKLDNSWRRATDPLKEWAEALARSARATMG